MDKCVYCDCQLRFDWQFFTWVDPGGEASCMKAPNLIGYMRTHHVGDG